MNAHYLPKANRTLLHTAASHGNKEIYDWLISKEANATITDFFRLTAIETAALMERTSITTAPFVPSDGGTFDSMAFNNMLFSAAVYGLIEEVVKLIELGASPNVRGAIRMTPLHFAAKNGHTETVNLLLAAGADMKAEDSDGMTPLHYAAIKGHTETVNALLAAGAKIEARDRRSMTPLHLAVINGHTETTLALIAAGRKS